MCPSTHLLVDTGAVSSSGPLQIKHLGTFMAKSLCEHRLSFDLTNFSAKFGHLLQEEISQRPTPLIRAREKKQSHCSGAPGALEPIAPSEMSSGLGFGPGRQWERRLRKGKSSQN